nr:MAG TPA: hypothetical protein [Caudoviricetes sp.]
MLQTIDFSLSFSICFWLPVDISLRLLPRQPSLLSNLHQHIRVAQALDAASNLLKRLSHAAQRVRVGHIAVNNHILLAAVLNLFLARLIQASGDLGNVRVLYNFNAITAVHKITNVILVIANLLPCLRCKILYNASTPRIIKQCRNMAVLHLTAGHDKIHKVHALLHGDILLDFHITNSLQSALFPVLSTFFDPEQVLLWVLIQKHLAFQFGFGCCHALNINHFAAPILINKVEVAHISNCTHSFSIVPKPWLQHKRLLQFILHYLPRRSQRQHNIPVIFHFRLRVKPDPVISTCLFGRHVILRPHRE